MENSVNTGNSWAASLNCFTLTLGQIFQLLFDFAIIYIEVQDLGKGNLPPSKAGSISLATVIWIQHASWGALLLEVLIQQNGYDRVCTLGDGTVPYNHISCFNLWFHVSHSGGCASEVQDYLLWRWLITTQSGIHLLGLIGIPWVRGPSFTSQGSRVDTKSGQHSGGWVPVRWVTFHHQHIEEGPWVVNVPSLIKSVNEYSMWQGGADDKVTASQLQRPRVQSWP